MEGRGKRAVFCDFDGTITAKETFEVVLRQFAPNLSAQLLPQIYDLKLTLRQGVRQILESIPSQRYPDILEFARFQPIRPGFVELLDCLERREVPIIVVSGGLRGMVETVLGSMSDRVFAIHAIEVDPRGEFLQVSSQFEGDTELVAKVKVMEHYNVEEAVAIGDSLTDLNLAMATRTVFARDRLSRYLDERRQPYLRWNDFFDVRDWLRQYWQPGG
jgi:2-hydroxy-3-keto-5-methylthiopentenyl-1-phosphate phosphatase